MGRYILIWRSVEKKPTRSFNKLSNKIVKELVSTYKKKWFYWFSSVLKICHSWIYVNQALAKTKLFAPEVLILSHSKDDCRYHRRRCRKAWAGLRWLRNTAADTEQQLYQACDSVKLKNYMVICWISSVWKYCEKPYIYFCIPVVMISNTLEKGGLLEWSLYGSYNSLMFDTEFRR